MPDIIKLLPDSVANQIAAGEVIQRPASAVKELLENAIDAGSTKIQLIIKDAGKTLIQVIDNGMGMSETDARMCFERHATSKITAAEDIFSIQTKGFRGEAMASIAAIAQVELKTRRSGEELGTKLIIEGSQVKTQEPCQCPEGTSIAIKNLFFNVPARRNFLKSKPVETRHIIDEFQRVALAHEDIHFIMHSDGTETFHLRPSNVKQRIVNVFGANFNQRIVPIDEATDFLQVKGYVGKPEYARRTRGEQYFFVNNRFIKSPYLNHAVVSAYKELLPKDTYPLYVIFLNIDPARIDVNVHPTKQEIKFDDERVIYTFVELATKRALGVYSITPTIDFDQEASLTFDNHWLGKPSTAQNNDDPSNNQHKGLPTSVPKQNIPANWDTLYQTSSAMQNISQELTFESGLHHQPEIDTPEIGNQKAEILPFQIHSAYILYQIKSGVIIIDQQAAHERILYERYLIALNGAKTSTQKLLFPITIQLTPADSQTLIELLPEISKLGYEIEDFGGNAFIIRGIPADLTEGNEQYVFEKLLEQYKRNNEDLKLEKRDSLARVIAYQTSIKKGNNLENEEMKNLVDQLFACETPYLSPSGALTFVTHSLEKIAKDFEKKNA